MSNPGSQAFQAAQQAQMSASRAAQDNAAQALRLNHARPHHYRAPRRGTLGVVGRLVSTVASLVVLVVVAVVALVVLTKVDPHLAEYVWRWLDRL